MRAALALALATCLAASGTARSDVVLAWHGMSAFGDLKYPSDFKHFDYVNPDAPKGGEIATTSVLASQTFDSLNGYILKGDPADGLVAPFNFIFDSLMVRAMDEPDAVYGLVARHAEYIPGKWVIFELREEAKFADGSQITAADVAFTFDLLKEKGHPAIRLSLRDVAKVEALSPIRVQYTWAENAPTRDLPMLVASLPIFSKAYYTENDFTKSSLDIPLSSGPYEIGPIERGISISYLRRDDYWAKDLPVNVGRWNFDKITFEYFKDSAASFDAFTSGKLHLREEFSSKLWGTRYDFPAIEDGRVIKELLPDERPAGTQGYWLNTRRAKFADPRVREAFDLAFDFEWSNRTLFYGLYGRTNSFFENSSFEASGKAPPEELTLLEPFRDDLPEEVFTGAYEPPVTDGTGRNRRNLRKAQKLLDEAGWTLKNGKRYNAKGEPFEVEFLDDSASFARITSPYIQNLEKIGISAKIRQVDRPQYQRRQESFDFDIVVARFTFFTTPGPELLNYFTSTAADDDGSFNLAGIKSPVADALVEKIIAAGDRDSMEVAARALDRVLRAGRYWIPQWTKGTHTIAYWDKFDRPENKPKFSRGILDTWWVKQ